MYCRHCGKQVTDDSKYCQYCGGMLETHSAKSENINGDEVRNINITGNVNVSNDKSLSNRILKFNCRYKQVIFVYSIWFIFNLLLLLSGSDRDGFYPRIFKDYHWWHEFTMPTRPSDYEEYSWAIEWKIENYGWVEFVFYVALLPLIIYLIYILCKIIRYWYDQYVNDIVENTKYPKY